MAFRIQEYATLVLQEAETQKDIGAAGRPPIVAPFVVYNGHAKWGAATDLADWIVPDPDPVLKRLLGLQMRRRYILVELKDLAPDPSDSPPDNWFSTLAEWENARWGRTRAGWRGCGGRYWSRGTRGSFADSGRSDSSWPRGYLNRIPN